MSERPLVNPLFLASVFDLLPARLRRRLEQEPDLARAWTWTDTTVEAAADAIVTLRAPVIASISDISCNCLLAPKCLHIAAVLRTLQVETERQGTALEIDAVDETEAAQDVVLDPKQRQAVEQMWVAGAAVLNAGAGAAGLVAEGELLRAIHSCRVAGLHRLAAAGLRMVERIRALRAERPEFRLDLLAFDFHELLMTARSMSAERVSPDWIGTARREYRPVGSLKLSGILTEPVVSATGYAGVVTYFADSQRRIWSLSDVAPGDATRCQAAYRSSAAIGDVSLPHLTLGRRALFVQRATASRDGRLGAGQSVGAVVAGSSGWDSEPIAEMFSKPLRAQLDSVWESSDRPAGFDLLFFRGKVVGARENALVIETPDGLIACFAPSDHVTLAYRDNLRLLGSVPNLDVLGVGRVQLDHPASVSLLAVSPAGAACPDEWLGRVNLGVDVLTRGYLSAAAASPPSGELTVPTSQATLPLDAIRRRLLQVVMGGSATVAPVTWSGIERDESMLVQCQLTTGATLLHALRSCGTDGLPRHERQSRLARAWLAASAYERSATAHVQRLAWLD